MQVLVPSSRIDYLIFFKPVICGYIHIICGYMLLCDCISLHSNIDSEEATGRPVSFYHGAPKQGTEVVQYLEATLKDPVQGATSWGFRS